MTFLLLPAQRAGSSLDWLSRHMWNHLARSESFYSHWGLKDLPLFLTHSVRAGMVILGTLIIIPLLHWTLSIVKSFPSLHYHLMVPEFLWFHFTREEMDVEKKQIKYQSVAGLGLLVQIPRAGLHWLTLTSALCYLSRFTYFPENSASLVCPCSHLPLCVCK